MNEEPSALLRQVPELRHGDDEHASGTGTVEEKRDKTEMVDDVLDEVVR